MKRTFRYSIILLLIAVSAVSCRSSYVTYVNVETMHPPKIAFPSYIRYLAFVNNAIGSSKFTISDDGIQEFSLMGADSLAMDMLAIVADSISHSPFFDMVTIGSVADTSSLILKKLTPTQLDEIRAATGAQTVITMDGFQMDIKKEYYDRYAQLALKFVGKTFFKIYEPGADNTPQTHICVDTMIWSSNSWGVLVDDMQFLSDRISEAIAYFAEQNINRFIPYLKLSERMLYVSNNPEMRDAGRYLAKDKWEEASYMWEYVYENDSNDDTKAKAAANLAVACEMKDDFTKAIEWAQKSYNLFSSLSSKGKDKENVEMLGTYIKLLEQRKKDVQLLQEQMQRVP